MNQLHLFGLTKLRIFFFLLLTLMAGVTESFGMVMIFPVLEFIETAHDAGPVYQNSKIWEIILAAHKFFNFEISFVTLLAAFFLSMMLRIVMLYSRQLYSVWLAQDMQHATRSQLFGATLLMNYGAFCGLSSGALINALTTEVQRAIGSFSALFALWANCIVILSLLLALFWLSIPLTVLSLVFMGIGGAVVIYSGRNLYQHSRDLSSSNQQYSREVLERFGVFRLIKLLSVAQREIVRVRSTSALLRDRNFQVSKIVASVDLLMEPLVLLLGCVTLYFAVIVFDMSLPAVGVFGLISLRLLPLAKELMRSYQTYRSTAGSRAMVIDLFAQAKGASEPQGGRNEFLGIKDSIFLSAVGFAYPNARARALQNVTIKIPAGKTTALVGPSGAGKSTLADLVACLHYPQEGSIEFDGVNARDLSVESLRRKIAFVSQETPLLDDTVSANLRFVYPEASDSELWDALKYARAEEFVRSLDDGLDTRLGEKGITLSGGQRQRLGLARALLSKCSILILDEPTSALDSETESDIQASLNRLRASGSLTTIVIAHRLATIRNADLIVVLREGTVTDQGTHSRLIVNEDWYARVCGLQSNL